MFVLQAVCIQPISLPRLVGNPSDSPTRNVDFGSGLCPLVSVWICLLNLCWPLHLHLDFAGFSPTGLDSLSCWLRKASAWTWTDSGRFAHYAKSSYPYGWASRSPPSSIDFDKTLGFPGEGPIWIWFIFVFFFRSSGILSLFVRLCSSLSRLLSFIRPLCDFP